MYGHYRRLGFQGHSYGLWTLTAPVSSALRRLSILPSVTLGCAWPVALKLGARFRHPSRVALQSAYRFGDRWR